MEDILTPALLETWSYLLVVPPALALPFILVAASRARDTKKKDAWQGAAVIIGTLAVLMVGTGYLVRVALRRGYTLGGAALFLFGGERVFGSMFELYRLARA